jgi:hypothetical protein
VYSGQIVWRKSQTGVRDARCLQGEVHDFTNIYPEVAMPSSHHCGIVLLGLICVVGLGVSDLYSQSSTFAIRGGVGTDIKLGVGFGIGGAAVWSSGGGTAFEFGADIYLHHLTDPYAEERNGVTVNGEDKEGLTVFAVRANALFNYRPSRKSVYFILGAGFVVAHLTWEENENAPNWTRPYHDEAEATSAGNIVNLGVGIPLSTQFDLRFEAPMLFFYSVAGKASSFAPTATLGLTYRFR